jgi:hypothetical protein
VKNGFFHTPAPVGHFPAKSPPPKRDKSGSSRFRMLAITMVVVVSALIYSASYLLAYFDTCEEIRGIGKTKKELEKQAANLDWELKKKDKFLKLSEDMDYFLDILRETEGFAFPDEKILPIIPPPRVR